MTYAYNFSVIIPHKNSVSFLKRCIASIPERSDLQVIVVDDNSDDLSIEALEKLNHVNLKICYRKEGKGAGFARNFGIENAEGKWLLFADADDFYEKDVGQFMDENVNSEADCIYFSVNSIDNETLLPGPRNFLYDEYIARFNPKVERSADWIMFNKWEPWNKMVSHDLVKKHHIRYEEISKCNDMMFNIMVSYHASRVKIVPDRLYCVTFTSSSMTFRRTRPEEFRDCIIAFKKKNAVLHKIGRWRWHTFTFMQHRHFLLKEGLVRYLGLLPFYLRRYFSMEREILSFKRTLKSLGFETKFFCDR